MMLLFDIKQEMYSPVITRCSLHTAAYYARGARITQYACTSTALQERKNACSCLHTVCTRKRTHLGFLPNDFGGRHFVAADV
jgi:hypothetical protein